MTIDHSVYPDIEPPDDLPTDEDKADYIHRLCGAWDFGVVPERETMSEVANWKAVFDRFPIPYSPAYHAFRALFGWEPVPAKARASLAHWEVLDAEEDRTDPCVDWV